MIVTGVYSQDVDDDEMRVILLTENRKIETMMMRTVIVLS